MMGDATMLPTTPSETRRFRLALLFWGLLYFLNNRRPVQIGTPMTTPGTATLAISAMMTGAPIRVATCQRMTFLRLHCFLPQNVQPDGLKGQTGSQTSCQR